MSLVTVITPTWQRADLLVDRCIPSVRAQTWPDVEHVVVCDGPDPSLARKLRAQYPAVVFDQLAHHIDGLVDYGSRARNRGLELASGDYVAYLDDDNAYQPKHVQLLVEALQANPKAEFAYSRMHVYWSSDYQIGSAPPAYGCIDTSLLMHRRGVPEKYGLWPLPGRIDGDKHAPDWAVVASWLAHGAQWTFVNEVSVDYWRQR
jgi:glycosyltransferase involved in cell wall biosynthesis